MRERKSTALKRATHADESEARPVQRPSRLLGRRHALASFLSIIGDVALVQAGVDAIRQCMASLGTKRRALLAFD